MTQATSQPRFPIFAESDTRFFLDVVETEVEFFRDDKGRVTYLVLHQRGQELKGGRQ